MISFSSTHPPFLTVITEKYAPRWWNIIVKKRLQETCQIFWNKELNEKKIDGTHNETSNDLQYDPSAVWCRFSMWSLVSRCHPWIDEINSNPWICYPWIENYFFRLQKIHGKIDRKKNFILQTLYYRLLGFPWLTSLDYSPWLCLVNQLPCN